MRKAILYYGSLVAVLCALCTRLAVASHLKMLLERSVPLNDAVGGAAHGVAFLASFAVFIAIVFALGYYPVIIMEKQATQTGCKEKESTHVG